MARLFSAIRAGRRPPIGYFALFHAPPGGNPSEIERVFAAMALQRPDAVLVSGEGDLYAHNKLIVELAKKNGLPTMGSYREHIEAGGLMAYGIDITELLGRMVDDVQEILKGAKPGDVPIFINPPNSSF
jgi:putative tryptophan/tyrosine transport system substrate-binding protein